MQRSLRKITLSLLLAVAVLAPSASAAPTRDEPTDPVSRIVRILKHIVHGIFPIQSNDDNGLIPPAPH